jgi:hypothetical protein
MRPFAMRGVYARSFELLADAIGVDRAQRVFVWLITRHVIAQDDMP